jgi:hypothetical protein
MRIITVAALAALATTAVTPALAQDRNAQARWDQAQTRYQQEFQRYLNERDAYNESRWAASRQGNAYGYADERYENGYDPARYYRQGNYQERVLSSDERVYAGNDGRYYCRRSDGTTGLIAGGAAGGVLGNVIDGGRSRTVGTLLGAAAGALAGKAIDQNQSQIRCR